MDTPHDLYRQVISSGRGQIEAIRVIRERFGLDLRQAKEASLQAEGMATSLDEHQTRLVPALEQALRMVHESRHLAPEDADGDP